MIIDTHLHLIDQSALNYPWLSGVPLLNRDHSYEEYAQEALRCGITDVLHMEVDVAPGDMEAETAHVQGLAKAPGSLLRGAIAACRPEDTGFAAYLDRQMANPFVKGFRRVLHVVADDVSEGALFRDNIRRLSGTGLTFDLVVFAAPDPQCDRVGRSRRPTSNSSSTIAACPTSRAAASHPWRERMSEIARRPNVIGKISGVVAYADPDDWSVATLRPYVEHTIACFGWDRVVWGSDWPVSRLGGGLSTWVAATHALIAGASDEERTKLMSGNARRVWGL